MTGSPENRSPIAEAAEWVSRITTVGVEMVLPGLAGHWLDQKFGTGFLALFGFALGLICGMWHLLAMTRRSGRKSDGKPPSGENDKS